MQTPLITVGILNWNGVELLKQFLQTVIDCTPCDVARIVVIDNGSTDDSLEFLATHFAHTSVEVLSLGANYGFAGGYNRAIREADTPYYCLLNSDVEVTPGWLDAPLKLLQADSSIALVQPKIRSFKQRDCFEYAGAAGGWVDYLGYPFCRGRLFDTVEQDRGQYDEASPIFWASGAALFVRTALYQAVGGLDERFFAHMEEIDLAWRMHQAGYTAYYAPDSVVYHVGGASLQMGSPKKVYLNFRNNLLMLYKNLPLQEGKRLIRKRKWLDGLSALFFLLQFNFRGVAAIAQAHRDYRKMRQHYTPQIDKNRTQRLLYPHSIVWQYFVCRKKYYSQLPK